MTTTKDHQIWINVNIEPLFLMAALHHFILPSGIALGEGFQPHRSRFGI